MVAVPVNPLADKLTEAIGAPAEITGRSMGGLSQETWFVTLDGNRQAVLRLPTAGSGARSIITQRRGLQVAAANGLPVPQVLAHDDGEANPFGVPFLVMSTAHGEVPGGWDDLEPDRRSALGADAMRVLARLHSIPVEAAWAAGLGSAGGVPAVEQLSYYRRRFAKLGVSTTGTVEIAFRWLEQRRPRSDEQVLVHNDFRMGNFVTDHNRLTAVLDWELASTGSPLADLSWCFIPVWAPFDVDLDGMVEIYVAESGRPVDGRTLSWFTVLGHLRLLYYCLSAGASLDRSTDLRLAALRLLAPLRTHRLLEQLEQLEGREWA
jgi:aminoglycoside phosphotransferase (APT) family kinase protein